MKTRVFTLAIPAMAIALCGFAAAQAPQGPQLFSANAKLDQNLDSAKVTQGETITAKLTSEVKNGDTVELAKGTTLVGKVEQVQNGNGETQLTVVFDQAKTRDGQTIPIKATLLGAYPPVDGGYWNDTGEEGSLEADQPHVVSSETKVDQEPGVLSHVALHSDATSDVSGKFTSDRHDINLKRGTQLQLAIAAEGAKQTAAGN